MLHTVEESVAALKNANGQLLVEPVSVCVMVAENDATLTNATEVLSENAVFVLAMADNAKKSRLLLKSNRLDEELSSCQGVIVVFVLS